MSGGTRAGVAYVDVRLGDTSHFFAGLQARAQQAGGAAARAVQNRMSQVARNPVQFNGLTEGLRRAAHESGIPIDELRARLARAGAGGADSFLREFTPLLRHGLQQSGVMGSRELVEALDSGTASASTVATLRSALTSALGEATTEARRTGQAVERSFGSSFTNTVRSAAASVGELSSSIRSAGQAIGFAGFQLTGFGYLATTAFTAPAVAVTGLGFAIGLQLAMQIEVATKAFGSMLGSAEKGKKLVADLQAFANASPIFDTDSVLSFSRSLLGAGVAVDKLIPSMKALSGIAAFYGLNQEQIARTVIAVNQVLTKGKVYMEELRQVQEAGIPITQLLAQAFSTTQKHITEMIAEGKISSQQFFDALLRMGNSGRFLEALSGQADTLTGKWQQFKETLRSNLAAAVQPQLKGLSKQLDRLGALLARLLKNVNFDRVTEGFRRLVDFISDLIDRYDELTPKQKEFAKQIGGILLAVGPVAIVIGSALTALSTFIGILGLLLDPLVLVVAAIIAGAVALFEWEQKTGRVSKFLGLLKDGAKALYRTFKPAIDNFVDGFKRLKNEGFLLWLTVKSKIIPVFVELFRKYKDDIKPTVVEIINFLSETTKKVAHFIAGLGFFLGAMIAAVGRYYQEHKKTINQIIVIAVIVIKFLVKVAIVLAAIFLSATFLSFVAAIFQIFLFFAALVATIITFIDWAKAAFAFARKVSDTIYEVIGKIVDFLQGLGPRVVKFLQELGPKFLTFLLELREKVIKFFTDLIDGLKTTLTETFPAVGLAIVDGIVNGVKSGAGKFKSVMKDMAKDAYDAVAEFFGVKSPSRLMAALGVNVALGLAKGITAGTPKVARASDAMAAVVAPRVQLAVGEIHPGGTSSSVTYQIYPQRANFTVADLQALQASQAARSRLGRAR